TTLFRSQMGAQLVPREDGCAERAEVRVAAGVVRMMVRVDEESNPAVRHLLDRGHQLVGELGELRVHHQHAIGSGEDSRVPDQHWAYSLEAVEIGRQLSRLDFHLAVVRRLSGGGGLGSNRSGGKSGPYDDGK